VSSFFVAADYPPDAARGGCYLTGASRGEIVEIDPATGADHVRPEKVIITQTDIDFEGRLCLSERIVRHLAQQLGMVDAWRVERLRVVHDAHIDEAMRVATELERAHAQIETLTEMVEAGRPKQYVATDGSTWPSKALAIEASLRSLQAPPLGADALRSIMADEAPLPADAAEKARR